MLHHSCHGHLHHSHSCWSCPRRPGGGVVFVLVTAAVRPVVCVAGRIGPAMRRDRRTIRALSGR